MDKSIYDHDLILTRESYARVYLAMDGSNITGLTHGMWETMCSLQEEQRARWKAGQTLPDRWLEHHPLVVLWLDKLCQLSDFDSATSSEILDNYQYVRERSET